MTLLHDLNHPPFASDLGFSPHQEPTRLHVAEHIRVRATTEIELPR